MMWKVSSDLYRREKIYSKNKFIPTCRQVGMNLFFLAGNFIGQLFLPGTDDKVSPKSLNCTSFHPLPDVSAY